jgi:hypothetical protein
VLATPDIRLLDGLAEIETCQPSDLSDRQEVVDALELVGILKQFRARDCAVLIASAMTSKGVRPAAN